MRVERVGPPGAFLATDGARNPARRDGGELVLLPRGELTDDVRVGEALDVFLHLDSEGRAIATTRVPRLVLGEVAFLEVTACTRIGAFVDWGLPKELLVPFAEQTRELRVGDRVPVGLYVDASGRLAGTMRVTEMLSSSGGAEFALDEWVLGEAWRYERGIGVFVIVERRFVGLLPESEPHRLSRGDEARFRVAHVFPDGKIELSLRGHAHHELASDADRILGALSRPDAPRLGDASSPEEIRDALAMSKKAFKRAAGRLLKSGKAALDADGYLVVHKPKGAPLR
jgi:predicted RNA-binding protein (virulence factor B family)